MGTIGKIMHIGADLALVSAVLAGIKRSTGLTFDSNNFENREARGYVQKYLDVGEWVFDTSLLFIRNSDYFGKQ
ncbi:DUF1748-domain-containing protein [Nadsonia fulvescens var. elongata DSM 6958]|uniref:DUF1748-domain-containing protein n=1 Tax=Nadsonia fulvescens var. elongata DSM 6958 TaxID=857566 RepID=A0A1E3PHE7_9ASCO|nr:DUF1748-domain-containing protein [Nadsonia fulvescens var. elongata DSM 6958]